LGLPFAFGFASFRLLLAYDRVARELHQRYASEPHWFLATIGVEPIRQGCGLGSSLMDPILIKADAQRMPCYLETHSAQNVTLYERHGFQVAERVSVASHPIPIWSMVRPPRTAP
jgi:ribosomal protein S18 acetylase RimI-like enzyme